MNHRELSHPTARRREALSCLALILLVPTGAQALPRSRSPKAHLGNGANSTAYLPITGAPPLRFQSRPALPDPGHNPVTVTPVPSAPAVALSVKDPAISLASEPTGPAVAPLGTLPDADRNGTPSPAATPGRVPPAIIPDDLRPAVRAEDFLPYFQMPGSARNPGDVTLLIPVPNTAPAPAALPPSSATYTQTPK